MTREQPQSERGVLPGIVVHANQICDFLTVYVARDHPCIQAIPRAIGLPPDAPVGWSRGSVAREDPHPQGRVLPGILVRPDNVTNTVSIKVTGVGPCVPPPDPVRAFGAEFGDWVRVADLGQPRPTSGPGTPRRSRGVTSLQVTPLQHDFPETVSSSGWGDESLVSYLGCGLHCIYKFPFTWTRMRSFSNH